MMYDVTSYVKVKLTRDPIWHHNSINCVKEMLFSGEWSNHEVHLMEKGGNSRGVIEARSYCNGKFSIIVRRITLLPAWGDER